MVAGATDDGLVLLEFAEPGRLEAQARGLQKRLGCSLVLGSSSVIESIRGGAGRLLPR